MPQGDNSLDDLGLATGFSTNPGDEISIGDLVLLSPETKMSEYIVDSYDDITGETQPDEGTEETYTAQFTNEGSRFGVIKSNADNFIWSTADGTVGASADFTADVTWDNVNSDTSANLFCTFDDPYNGISSLVKSIGVTIQDVPTTEITDISFSPNGGNLTNSDFVVINFDVDNGGNQWSWRILAQEQSGDFSSSVVFSQNNVPSSTSSITQSVGPGDTGSVNFTTDNFTLAVQVDFSGIFVSADDSDASNNYNN
jgi:hypothetical protein